MKTLGHLIQDGKVVGIVSGADAYGQQITVNGRIWRFDFDRWTGPMWLRKDGEMRECQNPNMKVWNEFDRWLKKYNKKHKTKKA